MDNFKALQIVRVNESVLILEKDVLYSVLKACRSNKVAVVSINGPFRSGKSFLLNMFLKKLSPKSNFYSFKSTNTKETGTHGIWMIDKPITIKDNKGEQFDLLLMDTQGMYDSILDKKTTLSIFALSTLISSFQIYNLDKRLQEDHLENLDFLAEYANVVKKEAISNEKNPFQHISLLIRDWQFFRSPNNSIDKTEAHDYLQNFLSNKNSSKDGVNIRRNIKNCFKEISCALLPHPGFEVTEKKFDGDINKIRGCFKELCDEYFNYIINNIEPKHIFERCIEPIELGCYIENYISYLNDKMPSPKSILNMHIDLDNEHIISRLVEDYNNVMNKELVKKLSDNEFYLKHQETKDILINKYLKTSSWGDKNKTKDQIIDKLNDIFKQMNYLNTIQKKSSLKEFMILGALILIKWFISGYKYIFVIDILNSLCNLSILFEILILGYNNALTFLGIDILNFI